MYEECIEVMDLAGPEDSVFIKCKTGFINSDLNTKGSNLRTTETADSKLEHCEKIGKTKRKCRQRKHRKRKHETESQEKNLLQTKSHSMSSTNTILNESSNKTNDIGDIEVLPDSEKSCPQNKPDNSLQDDIPIIFSDDSVPMPIISNFNKTSHKKCARRHKKRKVVYSPVDDCKIQNLVISLDAKVRHTNVRSTKKKHKIQPCTVPKERILPYCFRKTCCSKNNRGMCTKDALKRKNRCPSPKKQIISEQRYTDTKISETKYLDFMYEDISHGSFESDEEIDVLIKRTRERERERTIPIKLNKTNQLLSSSQYSLADLSDILSESGYSMEGKTPSIHSQVTMVVGEAMYTPTQFSPLSEDSIDYEPTVYDEDMSLDSIISVPASLHYNRHSEIDNENNNQFLSDFHDTILNDQTDSNMHNLKIEVPIIKAEVLEMEDNDVIDTALLCLPQNIKTERLDLINDLYVIKS